MVAEHSGTGFEKIGEHSDLSNDVGFEGVDAEAFMLAYSKKFGVDLSYFWYPDYFHQEHQLSNPLSWLFKYLGRDLPKKPLTIMMLAQAAAVGKWPARDTEISSS